MKPFAAAIALAALLPLAGCAAPHGASRGAWAYYDANSDYGQKGYDRPIPYAGEAHGEVTHDRPTGNTANPGETSYYVEPPGTLHYAQADQASAQPGQRCNCRQTDPISHPATAADDPSWSSTYYAIGP